jgi:hypothetical protein
MAEVTGNVLDGWDEGPLVYVAGSYDSGSDKNLNLQRAFTAAENVVKKGGFPVVPHMCHLWHSKFYYHKRDFWLKYSMRQLMECDIMIICPGSEFSQGVKEERERALMMGMEVLNYDEFLRLESFKDIRDINELRSVRKKIHEAGQEVAYGTVTGSDDLSRTEGADRSGGGDIPHPVAKETPSSDTDL